MGATVHRTAYGAWPPEGSCRRSCFLPGRIARCILPPRAGGGCGRHPCGRWKGILHGTCDIQVRHANAEGEIELSHGESSVLVAGRTTHDQEVPSPDRESTAAAWRRTEEAWRKFGHLRYRDPNRWGVRNWSYRHAWLRDAVFVIAPPHRGTSTRRMVSWIGWAPHPQARGAAGHARLLQMRTASSNPTTGVTTGRGTSRGGAG